jgi:predicted protein tyrosine phosphatase
MPIVDVRAISYEQMKSFIEQKPLDLKFIPGGGEIVNHNKIYIISITDPHVPKLFQQELDNVITFTYKDVEVRTGQNLFTFTPGDEGHMTDEHANKIIDFIEKAHSSEENIMLLVNCMFGMCRSGAIADFVGNIYGFGCWDTKKRNPNILPNHWNQFLLFKEYCKRNLK